MYLLGIDIGTTSVKSALFNEKLEEISAGSEEYELESHGAFVECEAEKYWEIVQKELDSL